MKHFVAFIALAVTGAGCAALGFTNSVLLRVPSPDGRLVAVCQEIPVFDGPEFDVRRTRRWHAGAHVRAGDARSADIAVTQETDSDDR